MNSVNKHFILLIDQKKRSSGYLQVIIFMSSQILHLLESCLVKFRVTLIFPRISSKILLMRLSSGPLAPFHLHLLFIVTNCSYGSTEFWGNYYLVKLICLHYVYQLYVEVSSQHIAHLSHVHSRQYQWITAFPPLSPN